MSKLSINNQSASITSPTIQALAFRHDIQGLRAIAIILVVLAHAGVTTFSGGFVGVDVFFVISGYLITGLLIKEYTNLGSIHLTGFFARRMKRLLPALLFMLCLVLLISANVLSNYAINEQTASSMYSATWTSNLFFAFSTVDYFAELRNKDLFLHTWSLGVEEQFYLTWSPLLLGTLTLLARFRGSGVHRLQLLLVCLTLFVGSLALLWYWTVIHPTWAFYLMPSRIWQFAIGGGVFVWFNIRSGVSGVPAWGLSRIWGVLASIIGQWLIIGSAVMLNPSLTYPGYWALLPSIGAALVIAAGHLRSAQCRKHFLTHPVLVFVGDRSYSWYLWHWPILMLGFSLGMQNNFVETVWLIALSFLLAILSYRLVEQPFWKGRFSHAAPVRGILLSLFAMAVVIFAVQNLMEHIFREGIQRPESIDLARSDLPAIYAQGCDAWYLNADVHPCVMGDPGATKTVVLLGDSISAQWYSLLPGIFRGPDWRTVVLTKSSCPMVDEDFFYERIGQNFTVCSKWRNAVLNYITYLRPNIVFVGSAATYNFTESQWTNGTMRVLTRLTAAADHVVVVPGTPKLSFDGPDCLARHGASVDKQAHSDSTYCREAITRTVAPDVAGYLARAVTHFQNAKLLNLNDLLCPDGYCAAQDPVGHVVFRDSQHLTNTFVLEQIPRVLQRLNLLELGPNVEKKRSGNPKVQKKKQR